MSQLKYWIVLSIGLLGHITYAWATSNDAAWLLRNYSKNNGLSQNSITAIIEDKQGVIWVGTQLGVHRFDGYEFTPFNRNRLQRGKGLLNDHIHDLALDGGGRLWAGTDKGLYFYSAEKNNFILFGAESYFQPVESLEVDDNGRLWVAGIDGLYKVDVALGQIQKVAFDNQRITALAHYGPSLLLVTNGQALQQYWPQEARHQSRFYAAPNQLIVDAKPLDSLNIIVATTKGLIHVQQQGARPVFSNTIENANVIFVSERDAFWVGTSSGLYRVTNLAQESAHLEAIQSNMPLQQVVSIHIDSNRLIWLGTLNDGLFLHNLSSDWIQTVNHESAPLYTLGKSVTALTRDKQGNIWQGSSLGLARQNWSTGKTTEFELGDVHQGVRSPLSVLYTDSQGRVWAGYRNGPLSRFDPVKQQFINVSPELNVLLTSINELKDGRLIFTTRNHGFFILDPDSNAIRQYSRNSYIGYPLASDRLQSSHVTPSGLVWLGSFDAGLYLYDPISHQVVEHFHQEGGLKAIAGNLVLAIRQSNEFELWVGTASGLSYINLNHGEVINFGEKHKSAGQTIYAIERDRQDRIWMTTNQGLVLYDQANLQFRQFNQEDGLPNDEFNSNALLYHEGHLYAGGVKGLARIDTRKVPPVGRAPKVLLTDFYLAGKEVRADSQNSPLTNALNDTQALRLSYEQNGFSIGFAAVNYHTPLKVQFRYQLSPLDSDWYSGNYKRRLATYTNLDSGQYEFRVMASLNGKDWGPERSLAIAIQAEPWRSTQAYALYIALTLSLSLFAIIFWRRKRRFELGTLNELKKKEQELSLALWGSGDEFWTYHVEQELIVRTNPLEEASYGESQAVAEFESYIHPKDLPWVKSSLLACVKGETESFELAFRLKSANGGWFWVLSKGKVTETVEGKARLISGANKDIDSLKRAQEALRIANDELEDKVHHRTKALLQANQELTQAMSQLKNTQEQLAGAEKMASLGNMVAGIAHEINTPLGVAITSLSHSEQSVKNVVRELDSKKLTATKFQGFAGEIKSGIQMALRNLHRAAELVNSFKQVSVDQSSELQRDFMLDQLLADTVNTVRPKFKRTNIEINVDCPVSIQMCSFPGALSQVVMNLMVNSYTHGFADNKQGAIFITARLEDANVSLCYRDTGKGIRTSDVNRVFDPFFTTNRKKGNTGLGLHICYNLISQKLRGEIKLSEPDGTGVEFIIQLPLHVACNNTASLLEPS